jgi:hypothetical protein
MKKVQVVFVLFLLAAIAAVAQTPCAPHPSDPSAVLIGSMTVTVEIAQSSSVSGKSGKKGTKCTVEQLICVWRTADGGVDLIGDPATVKLSGTCLTEIPTADLFALLGQAAVAQAVGKGYIPCNSNCDGKTAARFLTVTCVNRTGSGSTTKFGPCTTVQCVRAYTVCCPSGPGSPKINRAPASNDGCGTTPEGCQSACDQDCPPAGAVVE